MSEIKGMTVLVHDSKGREAVPRSRSVKVLYQPDPRVLDLAHNLFVLTAATKLPDVAEVVRTANRRHYLRALFVREDTPPRWLPQMLDRANLRTLKNTLVHSGPELPRRIMNAWRLGAQGQLVADASMIGNRLFVVDCGLGKVEIPFDALPALKQIPKEERNAFEIAADGSYIHWPASDIHLDLEAIRYAADPDWRKRADIARVRHDERLGAAIAAVRTAHGLRQSDIPGLSERQVRRIESGGRTKVSTLELLARAHGMDLDEYLDAVAGAAGKTGNSVS